MHYYTGAVKTAIGEHVLQFGNESAVVKYSKELSFELPEATELDQELKSGKDYSELDIPHYDICTCWIVNIKIH